MSDVSTAEDQEQTDPARDRVQDLRNELAEVNRQVAESEAKRNSDLRDERLDREAESLQQQIEAARERLRISQEENPEEILSGPTPATTAGEPAAEVSTATEEPTEPSVTPDAESRFGRRTTSEEK